MYSNTLPRNFPRTITIKLLEGQHNGQKQLWAPFTHEGKDHKLVITSDRYTPACGKGETWEVNPVKSPNGHIVFCRPNKMLLTARGYHPLAERACWQIDNECAVSLQAYRLGYGIPRTPSRTREWEKIGVLKSFDADETIFLMEVVKAVIIGRRDEKYSLAEDFLLEIPITKCEVRDFGNGACEVRFQDEDYAFLLQFNNHGHDPEEYVSEKGYDDGYYDEPREPDLEDLERREERYWSRFNQSDED